VSTLFADAGRFADIMQDVYWKRDDCRYAPLECQGPNENGLYVFNLGLDGDCDETLTVLRSEPWRGHVMLWIEQETHSGPEVWLDREKLRDAPLDLY
jgi:hypothetical protein